MAAVLMAGCATTADQPPPAEDTGAADEPAPDEPAPDEPGRDEPAGDDAATDPPTPAREESDDPAVTEPDEVSEAAVEALDFRTHTLDGDDFDGRDVAGSHVVLWMWAPW